MIGTLTDRVSWRWIRREGLFLGPTLLIIFIATFSSLMLPIHLADDFSNESAPFFLDGTHKPESNPDFEFRWSRADVRLQWPQIGRATYLVQLGLCQELPNHTQITVESPSNLGVVPLQGCRRLRMLVPANNAATANGDLNIRFTSPTTSFANRDLGVVLRRFAIEAISFAQPASSVLLRWLGCLVLLWVLVRGSLLGRSASVGVLLVLGVGASWLWYSQRMVMLFALQSLLPILALASLLLLGVRWLTRHWEYEPSSTLAVVRLAAVLLFVVRLWGLQYHFFIPIDHYLRVHQIQGMANGQAAQVQQQLSLQYEWSHAGGVPYSLLGYWLLTPLALIWPTDNPLRFAVEVVVAALEILVPLSLFRLIKREGLSQYAAMFAALTYIVLPVGFITYHDGSYPTILGIEIMTAWFVAVLHYRDRLLKLPILFGLAGLLAVALLIYVTHVLFVPLFIGIWVGMILIFGDSEARRIIKPLTIIGTLGFIGAMVSYYGTYLPTLITKTVPDMWNTIRTQGSVGRDPTLLPEALLARTIPDHAWAHYRVVPLVWTLFALPTLWRNRNRNLLYSGILAWLTMLALLALVDMKFGLWNKHIYFTMIGVALASGVAMGDVWQRHWLGKVMVIASLIFVGCLAGVAWYNRVVFYDWPKGSF